MQVRHMILELPRHDGEFLNIVSNPRAQIMHMSFSTAGFPDNTVRHYVLVVWQEEEYGDNLF